MMRPMKSNVLHRVRLRAVIFLLAMLFLLMSCEEGSKTGPIVLAPEDNSSGQRELFPEQRQLLDKLIMMSPALNPGPVQRLNPQWTVLASEFTEKYANEWKNPEALQQYAQELDRKDEAALRRLGEYFRLALCGAVLREDVEAGKREALRGLIELLKHEGESRLWSILQDSSGYYVDSPNLRLLMTVLPEAGVMLPYDWKPSSWYEKVYEKWLTWWKGNHRFLVYDADKQVYLVNKKLKESGKPVDPVSGEEMTPEGIKAYDAVLARILNWIANTRLY